VVVIAELQGLQKSIQKEASRKRRAQLQDIRTRLARAYRELDGTETGSDREAEVQETLLASEQKFPVKLRTQKWHLE
jgi:hypothetical protein